MPVILILLGALGLGTGAVVFTIRNLYYICKPSEVLIFAGGSRHIGDNRRVGYRLVKGGSSVRLPLLESAFRMDLTNMIIDLRVSNAYSKGGIPLSVEAVANIKIAGEEPTIHNAIERLLGKSRQDIEQMAKETLEGNLRGVLASLTPEQVNEDKIAFARSLLEEAEDDLEKLGLVLDTLQVQNISDDVNYLNSIGRRKNAELLRDARIAEAQAQAESAIQTAENEKNTSLRKIETQIEIARAEADRRVKDATTMRTAVIAESEAEIASEVARTQAEVAVQTERIEQVKNQLLADVVAPAEAACKRAISEARGDAAKIVEDGKATAEGTRRLAESWSTAGANAREIFLFQKLDVLLETLVSTVPEVEIQTVTAIDTSQGGMVPQITSFLEKLRQSSGIDLASMWRSGNSDIGDLPADPSFLIEDIQEANPAPTLEAAFAAPTEPLGSTNPDAEFWNNLRSDVQQFLDRIAVKKVTPEVANKSIERAIERYPKFKQRLRRALNAGGQAALDSLFQHPVVQVPSKMVTAWLEE